VFDYIFIQKLKKFGVFLAIYSAVFYFLFSTISYTLPFVLAIIIALLTRPLTRLLKRKLKFPVGIAALVSTLLVFVLLSLIVSIILYKVTIEAKLILMSLPSIEATTNFLTGYVNKLYLFYEQIDPTIVTRLQSQISSVMSSTLDFTVKFLNWLVSFAIGLPVILIVIFITFLATFFISKDMPNLENKVFDMFSFEGKSKFRALWSETNRVLAGYLKAYSTVVFVTFLQTFIGFSILKINYALILSILCALLDVMPILGIAAVYFPLSIFFFIKGNYIAGFGLIILYVIVTIVRQILEPKLVSSSVDLHPVLVLAAIFIGIKAFGFLGMIYFIFLMVFYNIFRKVNIL
jgi:sporulation integral membrane protein YtvI